jgi:hypothetical protein
MAMCCQPRGVEKDSFVRVGVKPPSFTKTRSGAITSQTGESGV